MSMDAGTGSQDDDEEAVHSCAVKDWTSNGKKQLLKLPGHVC
jgi:hypothetical protein